MEVFGKLLALIIVAFFAFLLFKIFKKTNSGKIIPGGGGTYPAPTEDIKPVEEDLVEDAQDFNDLSPETAVVLPEPTPTPVVKKKPAKKKAAKKDK